MQTDKLFHEFFQLVPQALFELLGIEPGCAYRFESPVVKAVERRMDGLLEPAEPGHPRYFLEVQGYYDKSIYWRVIQQVGLYHEQRPQLQGQPRQIVCLFLDRSFDPGLETLGTLAGGPTPWLIRGYVDDLLTHVKAPSPVLNVLLPLTVGTEADLRQQAGNWVERIHESPELDPVAQERLLELLAHFIAQKFSHLNRKEIQTMLTLTPIEETALGKELLEEGRQQGQVWLLADQIEQRFSIPASLVAKYLSQLKSDDLQALGRYFLKAQNYAQIEAWVAGRLAVME